MKKVIHQHIGLIILFLVFGFSARSQTLNWGDGVNLQPSYFNAGDVELGWSLMKAHDKIKTVRIEIEPDEGVSISVVQRWIQEANQHGYNVIATCHNYQYNGSDQVNDLLNSANWWKNNYASLIQAGDFTINIMNEWGSHNQTPSSYAAAYNQAIGIVRQVYNGPIVIDLPGWGQETQLAKEASELINDNNIVYSVHIYSSAYVQYGAGNWMTIADLDVLGSAGRPVIVGEFGAMRSGGADWSQLVDHAKSKGWTIIGWAWNGDGEQMNMTHPMWPSTPTSKTSYFNTIYDKLSANGGDADDGAACCGNSVTIDGTNYDYCCSGYTDPDQDGWGWNGSATCIVAGSAIDPGSCGDNDGSSEGCGNIAAWSPNVVYEVANMEVSYDGNIYANKW